MQTPINPLPALHDINDRYPEFLSGLPRDILFLIANAVDYTDIINICKTDKYLNNICHERAFWIYLIKQRYPEFQVLESDSVDQLRGYFLELSNRYNITLYLNPNKTQIVYAYTKEQLRAVLTAYFACLLVGHNLTDPYPYLEIKHKKSVTTVTELSNRGDISRMFDLKFPVYPVSVVQERIAMKEALEGKISIIAGQSPSPSEKVLYYVSDEISKNLFISVFCLISVNSKIKFNLGVLQNFLGYISKVMYPNPDSKIPEPAILVRTYYPKLNSDGNCYLDPEYLNVLTRNTIGPENKKLILIGNIYHTEDPKDPLWYN